MSYMGLFWETGMPEAWALSRKGGDEPEADRPDGSRLDLGTTALLWPQNLADPGANPVIPGQPVVLPGPVVGESAPDGKKQDKTDNCDPAGG